VSLVLVAGIIAFIGSGALTRDVSLVMILPPAAMALVPLVDLVAVCWALDALANAARHASPTGSKPIRRYKWVGTAVVVSVLVFGLAVFGTSQFVPTPGVYVLSECGISTYLSGAPSHTIEDTANGRMHSYDAGSAADAQIVKCGPAPDGWDLDNIDMTAFANDSRRTLTAAGHTVTNVVPGRVSVAGMEALTVSIQGATSSELLSAKMAVVKAGERIVTLTAMRSGSASDVPAFDRMVQNFTLL